MSHKLLNATGISLALLAITALPLQALAQTAKAPTAATEDGANPGMTVVRDADTGQLRGPTAAESAQLDALKAAKVRDSRIAPKAVLQRFHPNGARGARMTDEFMSSSIAVIRPNGTVETQCFDSKDAAEAALKAAPIKLETE